MNKKNITARLIDPIIIAIMVAVNKLFDLAQLVPEWEEKKQLLDFNYRIYINATIMQKAGWFFLLFVLLPVTGLFDYSSVLSFISYLAVTTGGIIGGIISVIGWLFFLLLELSIGWLLIYSIGKPGLRFIACLLAAAITFLPSFLIYTTYSITVDKTALIFNKAIALMVVSVVLHGLLFLVISELWAGINFYSYLFKKWLLKNGHAHKEMKKTKEDLHHLFTDLDLHIANHNPQNVKTLLKNRVWYVKMKLQQGSIEDEFDFSDYDPQTPYAP